jgi:APA family basic amino acid/polyamine antiporter
VSATATAIAGEQLELRRDVTTWGSYTWGYADVGADIYAALGLVIAAAQGLAPAAFALAGIVYIMIGLAYTELASTYPVAGGGHYFTLRGLGDFWGFVSGAALLLDYTIDIALFAVASAGYINFFSPVLLGIDLRQVTLSSVGLVTSGPLANVPIIWQMESLLLIGILIYVNIRGVRESSLLNESLGFMDIMLESSVIIFGFVLAWNPQLLAEQWTTALRTLPLGNFMYGSSLAIISFVGLESISQAAQETRRPATVIPRTSIALIFTVFIFALAFSTVTLGILPWNEVGEADPIAQLAQRIPYLGIIAGPFAAILGATILFISANTGVMGASRLTFSMSQLHLVTKWLQKVHPQYRTPVRTIVVFGGMGALEAFLAFFASRVGPDGTLESGALDTLGNMYAFGATLGYTLVFIALIRLRFVDPYSPRPYKMPLNLKISWHGQEVEFPVLGVIGMVGVSFILFEVILTHEIGRIAGPTWVVLCILYYIWYRRHQGLPVFGDVKHDWEQEQINVLTSAEEFDLVEEYRDALTRRDRKISSRNHAAGKGPGAKLSSQSDGRRNAKRS